MTSRGSKRSYNEADTETLVDSSLKFPRVGEQHPCTVIVSNLPRLPDIQHALSVYLKQKFRTVAFLDIDVDSYSAELSVKTTKQAIHVQKQLNSSIFEGNKLQCHLADNMVHAHAQNQWNKSTPVDSVRGCIDSRRKKAFVVLRKDCAIHIGRIPSGTTMAEVAYALKERIAALKNTEGFRSDDVKIRDSIMTHHGTSAIVEFSTPEFANLAVKIETCNGRKIDISYYRDNRIGDPSIDKKVTAVMIRNLPPVITARKLTDFLADRVEKAYFSEVKVQKCVVANNRSYAYMQFDSYLSAHGAMSLKNHTLEDHNLIIFPWRHSKSSAEMNRRIEGLSFDHESELELCTLCTRKTEEEPSYPAENEHQSEHTSSDCILDSSIGDQQCDSIVASSKDVNPGIVLKSSQGISPEDSMKHQDSDYSGEGNRDSNVHTDNEYASLYGEYSELSERHNRLKASYATALKEMEEWQSKCSILAKERDAMKAMNEAKALENEQLSWRLESSEQTAKNLASDNDLLQGRVKELNDSLNISSARTDDYNENNMSLLQSKLTSYEEQVKELKSTLQQLRQESTEEKLELRQEKRDLREEKLELKDKLKTETKRRVELEMELAEARRHAMAPNGSGIQHVEVVPERCDSSVNQPKSENDRAHEI